MGNTKEVFIHEVKLTGESDFARRFNAVSDLFEKANDPNLSKEEAKNAQDVFWRAKYCLEQGIGF